MQCIKCEQGELKTIRFKKTKRIVYVCSYCLTFWMEGEVIKYNSGHALDPNELGDEYAYSLQELNTTDQDHQEVENMRII